MADHVATYVLDGPDSGQVVVAVAKSQASLDRAVEVIMSAQLPCSTSPLSTPATPGATPTCASPGCSTERYPTLTFDATAIEPAEDGWTVAGTLAGCGHRTEIALATTVTPGAGGTLAVHATAEFDRRELGVTAPRFLIGTRIRITVDTALAAPH